MFPSCLVLVLHSQLLPPSQAELAELSLTCPMWSPDWLFPVAHYFPVVLLYLVQSELDYMADSISLKQLAATGGRA